MTIIDRSALRFGDIETLQTVDHVARTIARQEAVKFGIPDDGDDIAQTILMQFINASDTPRPDENDLHIEGYLRRAAKHCAQTIKRKRSRDRPLDSVPEIAAEASTGADDDTHPRRRDAPAVAPKRRRRGQNSKRTPRARMAVEVEPPLGPLGEATPITGDIVRRVRDTWGLTQAQMAKALGTSTHSLRNYEYGVVKEIPKARRTAIRRLHNTRLTERRLPLAGGGFLAIANRWLAELGQNPGDYIALSEILGKPRSTTWRWFNQPNSHPTMHDINRYQSIVDAKVEARHTHVRKAQGH